MPPVEEQPRAPAVETMRAPDLLSSVCHDLKAPLASIVMGAGFLRRSLPPGDESARRVVDAIRRAADGMSQLITNFSELAHLEMRDLTLNVAPCEVGVLVQQAFDELAAEADPRKVTALIELDPALGSMPCDRDRMLQILRQLLSSAMQVVPEGGSLVLQAGAQPDRALAVAVTARRPPGPEARRITSTPPKPALALAKGLIELHGGSMTTAGDEDSLTLSFTLPA